MGGIVYKMSGKIYSFSTKMIKSQSAGFPPPTLGVYRNTATFLLVLLISGLESATVEFQGERKVFLVAVDNPWIDSLCREGVVVVRQLIHQVVMSVRFVTQRFLFCIV